MARFESREYRDLRVSSRARFADGVLETDDAALIGRLRRLTRLGVTEATTEPERESGHLGSDPLAPALSDPKRDWLDYAKVFDVEVPKRATKAEIIALIEEASL